MKIIIFFIVFSIIGLILLFHITNQCNKDCLSNKEQINYCESICM